LTARLFAQILGRIERLADVEGSGMRWDRVCQLFGQWWLDGVLQGSYGDAGNSYNFNMFQFSPTWGGNVGAQKHQTDHYWFDHVHLSVR